MLGKFCRHLVAASRRLRREFYRYWSSPISVVEVPERPMRIRRKRLYVTVRGGTPGFGFMSCPCGCGETLHLRFFGDRKPKWRLARLTGKATVLPSIWRTTGCRSHFVLTE